MLIYEDVEQTRKDMDHLSFFTAFIAGIVSFLSPCVLPLIPGYISFVSGLSLEEISKGAEQSFLVKKVGFGTLAFVAGFSFVFTLLGASASLAGQWLSRYLTIISKIAGVVIIFFGLHTMGLLKLRWLFYEKRFQLSKIPIGLLGSFVMGLAFAFGWTPCIGPILAGILALAATQSTVVQGTLLLLIYSLGLGIPFILAGFGMNYFLRFFNRYKRFIRLGEIFSGLLLVFIGGLIFCNRLTAILKYLPSWFYSFSL